MNVLCSAYFLIYYAGFFLNLFTGRTNNEMHIKKCFIFRGIMYQQTTEVYCKV